MNRTVVLLTDFGLRDPFVGVMKCVIASIAPKANVIDLGHEVPRQDVRAGALALLSAAPYLPKRAVVVCVVDPGVGTARRAIAIETRRATLIGPDNGVLAPAAESLGVRAAVATSVSAVELREPRFFLRHVSSTFHGRDVFAPVAAHVARGTAIAKLGPAIDDWARLALPSATRDGDRVRGEVLRVDVFGNAITNVPSAWVPDGARAHVGDRSLPVVRTYGEVARGEAAAVQSSDGTLEIAIRDGDASKALALAVGDRVEISLGPGSRV